MLKMYQKTPSFISKMDESQEEREISFSVRGNKVHFISLGCPRNLVDTEVMLGILLKSGYEVTEELSEADYIIINTCGFLQSARDESLMTIEQATSDRKVNAKVIVTGCMVQTHSEELKKKAPSIDYLLGSGDVEKILSAVEEEEKGEQITSAKSYLEAGEIPRKISTPKHFAYLKIAEGCRKRCSYCIIPTIKGPLKSKPIERVIKEFSLLLDQGVKEVILIAQDLGDWGKDLGYRKADGLVILLKELLKDKRKFWLRLMYLYPDEITEELISLIKNDPRICPYLDMPIQHVNNDLLKSMRRKTSTEEIVHILSTLRKEIPEMTVRTSLIVGFPGETKDQYEELVSFVKNSGLDHVGIFQFSCEEGSHAATLPNQIDDKIKGKRQRHLAKVQQKVVEENHKKMIGKTLEAIVEGHHPDSTLLMRARHRGQSPEIDGEIIINDGRLVTSFGQWAEVEITDYSGYDLIGRVVGIL